MTPVAPPQDLLAQAAADCGAHARALLYFEAHVRAAHGGGYNPAAHKSTVYSDDDVSYLQARRHHIFCSRRLRSDGMRQGRHMMLKAFTACGALSATAARCCRSEQAEVCIPTDPAVL